MEIAKFSHESHDHELTFHEQSEKNLKKIAELSKEEIEPPLCYGCFETIHGPAYFCETCGDFWLHKSCFDLPSHLPKHPLHSIHPLTLIVKPPSLAGFFVCDGCRDISPGFAYHCKICRFNLDVKCALSTNCEDPRSKRVEIPYFGDEHILVFFNAKKEVGKTCTVCQLLLSGPAYGCLDCEFYLHESCKDMPSEIKHPYHPMHPLRAEVAYYGSECDACHMPITKIFYRCSECDFNLHILCANKSQQVASALKHKRHEHNLYYFVASYFNEYSLCNTCHEVCKGSYYLCLECKYYAHLDCIPLPRVVENDSHSRDYSHSLTLMDSFVEDDSGQYYCEVCQKERSGAYHVYCCEQCHENPYLAHIECLMLELMEAEGSSARAVDDASMVNSRNQNDGDEKGDSKCLAIVKFTDPLPEKQIKIKDFWHEHILLLDHNKDAHGTHGCYWCRETIFGPSYTCGQCSRKWHKSCAELLPKKTHTLHSKHTLTMFHPYKFDYFICDSCGDLCHRVASYHCYQCHFFLDMKCASLSADQWQNLKKMEKKTKDFCHKHKLTRANCVKQIPEKCKVCQLPIVGTTYCCINCNFFLHESCLETPQEIRHPFHLHPLHGRDFDGNPKSCRACKMQIWDIAYYCDICDFVLHFTCASYLTSTLKHKCHQQHTLFSFVTWDLGDQGFIQSQESQPSKSNFSCEACGNDCSNSFYRCVECDINRHLECIPLPFKVLQKDHHFDPLVLKETAVEDDSGEYYCEICQGRRNPNLPVYCCDMCSDNWFIAHIGCVIVEGDTSLEVLEYRNNDFGSDSEQTPRKVGSDSEREVDAKVDHDAEGPKIIELD